MSKQTYFFNHSSNENIFKNYAINSAYTPKLFVRSIFQNKAFIKIVDTYCHLTNLYLAKTIEDGYSSGYNPFIFRNKKKPGAGNATKNLLAMIRHIKLKETEKEVSTIGRIPRKYKKEYYNKLCHPIYSFYKSRKKRNGVPVYIYKPVKSGYIVAPYRVGKFNTIQKPLGSVSGFLPRSQYKLVIQYYKERQQKIKEYAEKMEQKTKNKLEKQNKKENISKRKSNVLKVLNVTKCVDSSDERYKYFEKLKESLSPEEKKALTKDTLKMSVPRILLEEILINQKEEEIEDLADINPKLYQKSKKVLERLSRKLYKNIEKVDRKEFEAKLFFPRNLMLRVAPVKVFDMLGGMTTFLRRNRRGKLQTKYDLVHCPITSPRYVFTSKRAPKVIESSNTIEVLTKTKNKENKENVKTETTKKKSKTVKNKTSKEKNTKKTN